MKILLLQILLLPLFTGNLFSQNKEAVPHLRGDIQIDTKRGLIVCDLTIENIPEMKDLTLALNRGMTVKYLKADAETIGYNIDFGVFVLNSNLHGAISYSPTVEKTIPNTNFHIKYTGAFPTHDNDYSENDYSDSQTKIAFKNNILRASYLTKWYPFLYDRETNELISRFTYDLNISGDKSVKAIYVNGSNPHKGQQFRAVSGSRQNILLYIGDYKFSKINDTYFLNSNLTTKEKQAFDSSLRSINDYYSSVLNTPNNQKSLVLAQIFSVGRKNQYQDWALAEYPATIANLEKHSDHINTRSGKLNDAATFRLYAHELVHQYWGLSVYSSNEYAGFYSESFAEYFSLKTVERFLGNEEYKALLKQRYLTKKALKSSQIPLNQIGKTSIKSVNPWYRYYSLTLLGLEQTVGKEKVFNLFRYLLNNTNSTNLDYNYFKDSALRSGITQKEWETFENDYVNTQNCLKKVLAGL